MKIPPGWRDADALSKRIPDKGLHASMFGTAWPRGQGLNWRFVTLRIGPADTYHQAPGLCGELLEHHPVGVGDAARPPEGNLRAGFPGTLGLRRAVGIGCRRYRYRPVFRVDTAALRGNSRRRDRLPWSGSQYPAGIVAGSRRNPHSGSRQQFADVRATGAHNPQTAVRG